MLCFPETPNHIPVPTEDVRMDKSELAYKYCIIQWKS